MIITRMGDGLFGDENVKYFYKSDGNPDYLDNLFAVKDENGYRFLDWAHDFSRQKQKGLRHCYLNEKRLNKIWDIVLFELDERVVDLYRNHVYKDDLNNNIGYMTY